MTIDQKYFDLAILYIPKVLLAGAAMFAGFWVIRKITEVIAKNLERAGIDKDLRPFLTSLLNVGMKIVLLLFVANIVGIETASFVAIFASVTFAIGFALQGSLANFAAGLMILIFKPYRIGDLIEVQGQSGHVREIQTFNTLITTLQKKVIIIPNSTAMSGVIGNLTTLHLIKIEIFVPIRYGQDLEAVESLIRGALAKTALIQDYTTLEVEFEKFEGDGFLMAVRAPVKSEDIETVQVHANRNIYIALTNAGILLGGFDRGKGGGGLGHSPSMEGKEAKH